MINPVSSVITGGVTMSAATLVPLIQWIMSGLPKPVPEDIPYLVAAGLVTGVHALYNIYAARAAAKVPTAPATPSIIQQ